MALGLGVLKLQPAAFWSMTLREVAAVLHAVDGGAGSPPLGKAGLSALMLRFPD